MDNEELIKKADIQKIAAKGAKIYETIKSDYEPQKIGQFLAIDVETKKVYFGKNSAEAVESARKDHPDTVFYVVKIGFEAAETMARSFLNKK